MDSAGDGLEPAFIPELAMLRDPAVINVVLSLRNVASSFHKLCSPGIQHAKLESRAENTGFVVAMSYSRPMTERQDLCASLEAAGIFDAIRWAYASATGRALNDHAPAAGYNPTSLGINRHVLFCDRLDRVCATGNYAIGPAVDDETGLDLLHAELSPDEIANMPEISASTVRRADLNGSPGWSTQSVRFLLQSSPVGKIEELAWPQKRPTKQKVARQPNPEPDLGLLADLPNASSLVEAFAALSNQTDDLGMDTFVVAHALDGISGRRQLMFGRPRFNPGGGEAWYWLENLLATPLPRGSRAGSPMPVTGPDSVPDAPVKLRRVDADKSKASGQ